jgi:ribonuclease HI
MTADQQKQQITIWTDGGARGNPGPAGIGVRIIWSEPLNPESVQPIAELAEYIGETTNNQAEYRALLRGLEWLRNWLVKEAHKDPATIKLHLFTDSELMAYQIQGRYKVKNADLRPHFEQITRDLAVFAGYVITPIPRAQNQIADKLVNQAIDKAVSYA